MALECCITTGRYRWHRAHPVYATGFIWELDQYISGLQLTERISSHCADFQCFRAWCSGLNGQFSFIVQHADQTWLACSLIWAYPLFYSASLKKIFITDTPEDLARIHRSPLAGEEVQLYFLQFCATPGAKTLAGNISQLQPGEVVCIDHATGSVQSARDIGNLYAGDPYSPEKLRESLFRSFRRYYHSVEKKRVLLPLTCGYDSRLLACLLKEYGHRDVVCATWGRATNPERVAQTLGFKYHFITYDPRLVGGFTQLPEIIPFLDYCGHLSSMPYLQDYFAVKQLTDEGIIDDKTVAIPGLSGDFIRGSHLYDQLPTARDKDITRSLISMFGNSYARTKSERKMLADTILKYHFDLFSSLSPTGKFDLWDYTERQAKFIGNSSQVYNYFGMDHMAVLLDREIVDLFLNLPFEQRIGSKLYNETLEKLLFKPLKVDFDLKPPVSTSGKWKPVKERISAVVPRYFKKWYYPMQDDVYYREITSELMKTDPAVRYRHPLKSHYYNCYLVQWYLNRVRGVLQRF